MTNDQTADAEAIAKLRAWKNAASNRWYDINEYSNELWPDTPFCLSLHANSGGIKPVIIVGKPTLPAAVDAALKAWERMEAEQP